MQNQGWRSVLVPLSILAIVVISMFGIYAARHYNADTEAVTGEGPGIQGAGEERKESGSRAAFIGMVDMPEIPAAGFLLT